jgi:cytochrome c biogenesis protein ResB
MNKLKREVMWAALALIILLIVFSIYGAFIGAARAEQFFNRVPLAVFWAAFAILLIVAVNVFPRLVRVPGLLLMHAGCILILAGGMWGSRAGHALQEKFLGIEKIRTGRMTIYEGHSENHVIVENEDQKYLFSIKPEFESDLGHRTVSEELRQEFEKHQMALSQHVKVLFKPEGNAWVIADNLSAYIARKEDDALNIYAPTKELPFSIGCKDFRIEYYEPANLEIEIAEGQTKTIPAEVGQEIDLGGDLGKAKIVRAFENFKMSIKNGKHVAFDDPRPGSNPALEVQVTDPNGQVATQYVFSLMPGFGHTQAKLKLTYSRPANRAIKDYISELEVVQDGQVVAEKDIEVNHPLYFGGYHFYQSDYDHVGHQYTVLSVYSDTGLRLVFIGYWMLCIGIVWHLWLRHIIARIKSKK